MTWIFIAAIVAGFALIAMLLAIVAKMPPSRGSVRPGSYGSGYDDGSSSSVSDPGAGGHCHGGDVGGGDCGGGDGGGGH